MNYWIRTTLLGVMVAVVALPVAAQDVVRYADTAEGATYTEVQDPLDTRFAWALDLAGDEVDAGEFWVVYTIQRTMKEGSMVGSWGSGMRDLPSVGQVLTGESEPTENLQEEARRALDRIEGSERLVQKEVAVLVRVGARDKQLDEIHLSNLGLAFDFEGLPVFWLGGSSDSQSISFLERSFRASHNDDLREEIVSAVGLHESDHQVLPFVLYASDESFSDDIRQNAVFWLGRFETPENIRHLFGLAQEDASDDVRDSAVFSLNRMSTPEALDPLIRLARTGKHEDVRENARFWLGQKASNKLAPSDVPETEESEIQKQALMALTHMDDDDGVPELIELATTHRNPAIRKQAVFWLGQSGDERALETIVSILMGS